MRESEINYTQIAKENANNQKVMATGLLILKDKCSSMNYWKFEKSNKNRLKYDMRTGKMVVSTRTLHHNLKKELSGMFPFGAIIYVDDALIMEDNEVVEQLKAMDSKNLTVKFITNEVGTFKSKV